MKKVWGISVFSSLFVWSALAQSQRATLPLQELSPFDPVIIQAIPLPTATPFLAWSVVWRGEAEALQVRFSPDGRSWSRIWTLARPDAHVLTEAQGYRVSALHIESAQMHYLQVRADAEARDVVFHFFSPGASAPMQPAEDAESFACLCSKPPYLKRQDWCPAGNCPPHPNPSYTTVTHVVVHHSATSSTANDWAAVVRAIWDFHVNTNGWADIGYNWLIDPNGVLYEGRGDNVIGAHFCGKNAATMGVCVIGDFTNQMPTTAARNRLRDLIAWKLCTIGARPLDSALHMPSGLVLPRVCGHRDGCSTACPGNMFYPTLSNVRTSIANYIAQVCSAVRTDYPQERPPLLIYPNPARQTISVNCPEVTGAWLYIFYSNGRPAQAPEWLPGDGQHEVNVTHLPSGIYRLLLLGRTGRRWQGVFAKW